MYPFENTSCIILSAGNSDRMGEHKALLNFDENSTFIEQITNIYIQAGIEQIIVVVSNGLYNQIKERRINLKANITLVINEHPELGRFYSLQTGINCAHTGNYCFFQNIDNPFTSIEVLNSLIQFRNNADVIIPTFQNKSGHPVLLSNSVIQKILTEKTPDLRIDEFLKKFNVLKTEVLESSILVNLNSPEGFAKAGFK